MGKEALFQQAFLIVEGTVSRLAISKAAPHWEGGWADTDWAIDVTIKVDEVRRGSHHQPTVTFRCFRLRTRKRALGFLTVSGHHPIPPVGSRVVAYLERWKGGYRALTPDGIQPADPDATLLDAPEVASLPAPTFSFIVSVEMWIILGVLAGILWLSVRLRRRGRSSVDATDAV